MWEQVYKNMFQGGSLWAGVVTGGLAQLQDTVHLTSRRMKVEDYAAKSTKNVGMALGTMAGVEFGAVVGSAVLPGVGTILGSIVGGLAGDRLGSAVGAQAGGLLFKNGNQAPNQPAPEPRQVATSMQ